MKASTTTLCQDCGKDMKDASIIWEARKSKDRRGKVIGLRCADCARKAFVKEVPRGKDG